MIELQYTSISSPLGDVWIAGDTQGVVSVEWGIDEAEFYEDLALRYGTVPYPSEDALGDATAQIGEYVIGRRRSFDLAIHLIGVKGFARRVLEAVRTVPYGETRSYGDIAAVVGSPRAARAVGGAVAINPISFIIPCHRIIRSDGSLGEYGRRPDGVRRKRMLLALEGRAV